MLIFHLQRNKGNRHRKFNLQDSLRISFAIPPNEYKETQKKRKWVSSCNMFNILCVFYLSVREKRIEYTRKEEPRGKKLEEQKKGQCTFSSLNEIREIVEC